MFGFATHGHLWFTGNHAKSWPRMTKPRKTPGILLCVFEVKVCYRLQLVIDFLQAHNKVSFTDMANYMIMSESTVLLKGNVANER